ncbi:MAG: hypothetical protein WA945_01675 [Arcobacteraceae bacterium]
MNPTAKQNEFIILRADGISFDKIAKQLKTSKPTLIQWSKLFESEIKDLQFSSYIEIKESYKWNKKEKYKTLLKQLNKIDDGINGADLKETSIKDLFTIKNNIIMQLDSLEKRVTTDPKISQTDEYGIKEQLTFNLYEFE